MSDIVERLRGKYMPGDWGHLAEEAAEEIERLRAIVNGFVEKGVDDLRTVAAFQVNEELREALEWIVEYASDGPDVDVATCGRIARRALEPKP
jgi:hypothetical protein